MIYLLANQHIGEGWIAQRRHLGLDRRKIRVLSHHRHVMGIQLDPERDRVIEVGFGPHNETRHALDIKRELIRRGWPAELVEWEPMIPADRKITITIDTAGINLTAAGRRAKAFHDAAQTAARDYLVKTIRDA